MSSVFRLLISCAVLLSPSLAMAAEPYLVKDIRLGSSDAAIREMTVQGDRLYFLADDGLTGLELWTSDGTEAGTERVLDLVAGPADSGFWNIVDVEGTLFLTRFGEAGVELWTSDGSSGGTQMVKDLPSLPIRRTEAGGLLFFDADSTEDGTELWRSDGTEAGTFSLDLRPGPDSSFPNDFIELDDILLFEARDAANNQVMWTSDGTPGGTNVFHPVNFRFPVRVGSAVYFTGILDHGQEPWKTDGTLPGTFEIADIAPGGSNPTRFTALGDIVLFRAFQIGLGSELWRTDDTAEGTELVRDIARGNVGSTPGFQAGGWVELGGRVYFPADDDINGAELWVTDGTEEGTVMYLEIWPGPKQGLPLWLTEAGGLIYFAGESADTGAELWSVDGSPGGAVEYDLRPGIDSSAPQDFEKTSSHVFFLADNGTTGLELWAIDYEDIFADGFESGDTSAWGASVP